jgi:esterase/lipase superfamily enzyme
MAAARPLGTLLAGLVLLAAAGCSGRGTLSLDPAAADVGTVETILVATDRSALPAFPWFGDARAYATSFAEFAISVPPDRKPGSVRFPKGGRVNPERDFLVVAAERLAGRAGFVAALNRALVEDPGRHGEALLFIHGYNTNFAEGLVRQAQLRHDLKRRGASVQFAWPSRAKSTGYLYDRESVIFSRGGVEQTLHAMAASRAQTITIVAHSMGSQLAMDTLSTMARLGDDDVFAKLRTVVLISADMEIDVFRKLAPPVLARGVQIFLLVSDKDRALEVSARMRGETDRLGSVRSTAELGGLDVTVIDVTQVRSTDFLGHLKEGTSPALIAFLDNMGGRGIDVLDGDVPGTLVQGGLSLIQQGANIVLAPLALR